MLKIQFKNNAKSAVWLVEPKIIVGSERGSNLLVSQSGVAGQHFEIAVEGDDLTLCPIAGNDVMVNGEVVSKQQHLNLSDEISFCGVELEVIDPKSQDRVKPKARSSTGWALKANHASLDNKIFTLSDRNMLGRSADCDITISAAHLSRRHAELIVKDGQLFVQDLQSANGTFLNGERITQGRVRRGDELRFDTLPFGVVGPADDMDRTTVRAVKKVVPAKPKAAASQKAAARVEEAKARAVKNEHKRRVQEAMPKDSSAEDWEETSSVFSWLMAGGVLVAAVVGALFYFGHI